MVKKEQKKAEKVIKKVTVNKEAAPGGIIDLVSKQLAKNAKVQEQQDTARSRIETAIKTRIAAGDTKIKMTRDSLKSGLKATKEVKQPEVKEVLKSINAQPGKTM